MRRHISLALGALVVGCTVGPKYVPETVVSPSQRIGVERMSDSSRAFFDSLAVERRRDTVAALRRPAMRQVSQDSLEAAA